MTKIAITGAGTGLGKELALQYAQSGNELHLIGRTQSSLEKTANDIREKGAEANIHIADLTSEAEVHNVFTTIGSLDILINNAGIGYFGEFLESTTDEMDKMFEINSFAPIYTSRAVLPIFKEKDHGTIINIISTAGLRGKKNEALYVSSKFALRGFTESLQKEYEETGIRIVGAYMGGMNTPFWDDTDHIKDKSRLRSPQEIAEIIVSESREKTEIIIESKK
ncbi:SDR family NAD(P)-dependent oxidoreductase [Falsibacillus albus]|uniref:SDR family oxidoreductase n=1 Tax=Falsibacillus albus TaxID=2478915 RepID=A0A3L7JRP8_9BACI|nr:SDR family oxidoreductase [Falsibacillus albus]RLQ92381.1 SDR family oxidoreductase [Falsibacillus albus]